MTTATQGPGSGQGVQQQRLAPVLTAPTAQGEGTIHTSDSRGPAVRHERLGLLDRGRLAALKAMDHASRNKGTYGVVNVVGAIAALATGNPGLMAVSAPLQEQLTQI